MVFPPGQGKSGAHLMHLWRQYLEQYAEHEGSVEEQIIVGAYHAAEVIGALTLILDRERKYRSLIEQRIGYFVEGAERAQSFEDRLVNGTFSLYNHLNTLAHQFTVGHGDAESLIHGIDEQVRVATQSTDQIYRSAFALRAAFPLAEPDHARTRPGRLDDGGDPADRSALCRRCRSLRRAVAATCQCPLPDGGDGPGYDHPVGPGSARPGRTDRRPVRRRRQCRRPHVEGQEWLLPTLRACPHTDNPPRRDPLKAGSWKPSRKPDHRRSRAFAGSGRSVRQRAPGRLIFPLLVPGQFNILLFRIELQKSCGEDSIIWLNWRQREGRPADYRCANCCCTAAYITWPSRLTEWHGKCFNTKRNFP